MSPEPLSSSVDNLARQAQQIIEDPEMLYDIIGRRLSFRAIELVDHFRNPKNRRTLGILWYPNSGKTTLAYTCYKILETYGYQFGMLI